MAKKQKRKDRGVSRAGWVVRIFFLSVAISAVLSFFSSVALEGADFLPALAVLLSFVLLGIVFDIIGVAVTAADPRPFHSMASHREKGAEEALFLIRNSDKVSNFCNDVVGDICGIVSGTTAAVLVAHLQKSFTIGSVLISIAVTALISGLTIGGKAIGKNIAIDCSTAVVFRAGRIMHFFHRGK